MQDVREQDPQGEGDQSLEAGWPGSSSGGTVALTEGRARPPTAALAKLAGGQDLTQAEIEREVLKSAIRMTRSKSESEREKGSKLLFEVYRIRAGGTKGPGRPRAAKEAPPSTLGLSPERAPYEPAPPKPVDITPTVTWTPPAD